MSKVVACFKWVVDEADLRVNSDLSIDYSKAKNKISEYDKNAIAEAVKTGEALGSDIVGLTFGTEAAKPAMKDALSRGLSEAYWVKSDLAKTADGFMTAKALAGAIQQMDDVKLVFCAEGSSDMYARQTAARVGALLDWAVVTSVCSLKVEGNVVVAERKLDDCVETVRVEMPAVIAVLPEINEAPLPGLKAVLAAGKKPVTELSATDLAIDALMRKTTEGALQAYVMVRKNIMIKDGSASEKVQALIVGLKKEGVL